MQTEKYVTFLGGNGKISGKRIFHEKAEISDKIAIKCPWYLSVYHKPKQEAAGQRSAYRAYLDAESEYEAALEIVGDYPLWLKLCEYKWFMEGMENKSDHMGLETWREHKALKLEQEAIKGLRKAAEEGNVSAQNALHKIAKDQLKKTKAGRPKDEVEEDPTKFSGSSVSDIFSKRKV